ncbi:hypothetical protein AC249_AIPGENE8926 [Exaiptasia diaphana]|nr:hypothetical protein AC249_AIPGENE8926 [Exaiptasia diaphana]
MDVDGALEGRITARPGAGFFLRARYQNLDASGTQVLDFDVDVGGVELPIEVDLDSFLDFEYGGVALGWQFRSAQGKLRIGPFAEAKGVRGSTGLEAALLGQSAGLVEDFEGGFLSYGVLLEIEPTDRLQLFAEISVLADDDEADLTDTERLVAVDKLVVHEDVIHERGGAGRVSGPLVIPQRTGVEDPRPVGDAGHGELVVDALVEKSGFVTVFEQFSRELAPCLRSQGADVFADSRPSQDGATEPEHPSCTCILDPSSGQIEAL